MVGRKRATMSLEEEPVPLSLEDDGSFSLGDIAKTKQGGIQGFLDELREAHRYVNNRRSAIGRN